MNTLIVKTSDEVEFFARGRVFARMADQRRTLPEESVVSFCDPAELGGLLTPFRLALLGSIEREPGSIADLSERLARSRSAVRRDVDELANAGLLTFESRGFPGERVRLPAQRLRLEALPA
ncbi:MarR family transcriptional regulator [Pseudoduganella sp. LjRoot289]|uniref:HVO_A0114 family putative DNA-binding protein n=1 Tax=Pseudoduganella sp. LjRoot289 TaxID=3342314 RepID=UPI003ECDBD27